MHLQKLILTSSILAFSACGSTPEPIYDYNAPYLGGKYSTLRPEPRPIVLPCPWDTDRYPWGVYPIGADAETHCARPHDGPQPPATVPPGVTPPSPVEPPATHRDNGLGNGDDPAPGKSLPHNRAENEKGSPGHKSGKPQNSN